MFIAVIPAKGKSNRLPNKNMSLINGRPLIDYSIDYAKKSKFLDKIFVSTDDILIRENRMKIAEACFKFLEHRVNLDLSGWSDIDIFKH